MDHRRRDPLCVVGDRGDRARPERSCLLLRFPPCRSLSVAPRREERPRQGAVVSVPEQAGPGDVTFFASPKYARALRRTHAGAVILDEDTPAAPCPMLRTKEPYLMFANALSLFVSSSRPEPGIDRLSSVASDASLGRD